MNSQRDQFWKYFTVFIGISYAVLGGFYAMRNDRLMLGCHVLLAAVAFHQSLCTHDGVTAYPIFDKRR